MTIDLKDLTPLAKSIKIGRGWGKKITIHVRPFSLADDAWLQSNFKEIELAEMYKKPEVFGKILFHQLTAGSKSKIIKRVKIRDVNKDGDEIDLDMEGWEKMLHAIQGKKQEADAFNALMLARGISSPEVAAQLVGMEEKKKKPTGARLLIWLRQNTVGA
ncbi:MAG: hypothetical protein ACUZ8E_17920 [Candidatus Anammoxibacter sp.]